MSKKASFKETPMDKMLASFQSSRTLKTETAKSSNEENIDINVQKDLSISSLISQQTNKRPSKKPEVSSASDGNEILMLDPNTIKAWKHADRPESEIIGIQELSEDIQTNGQSSPILVRKLKQPISDYQYEYIFGCRRLAAAQLAGLEIKAIVHNSSELSDDKAFALMYGENENREDLSPWAKSKSFKKVLNDGLFESQRKLSIALGKNENYIKDLMIYEKIPFELAEAIGPMTKVSILMARTIVSLSKNKKNIDILKQNAIEISKGHLSSRKLTALTEAKTTKSLSKKYSGKSGDLFNLKVDSNGTPTISILKSCQKVLPAEDLLEMMVDIIDEKTEDASS